jgi:metal-dependent amidase/aminoacylase/carboxypeptidase family protein
MAQQFKVNASALLGADQVTESGHRSGSTDMGDISHVMPTLHPYMGGATGSGHGADYTIADPKLAYLEPAKQLALMAVDLLWDDAAGARDTLEGFTPRLTKDAYLAFQRSVSRTEAYDAADL